MEKSLVKELIKLGNASPSLRNHIRPVLDSLKTASRGNNIQSILSREYDSQFEREFSRLDSQLQSLKRDLQEKIFRGELIQREAKGILQREIIPDLTEELNTNMRSHLQKFVTNNKHVLERCLLQRINFPLKDRIKIEMETGIVTKRDGWGDFEALDAHFTFNILIRNDNLAASKTFLDSLQEGVGDSNYFQLDGQPKSLVDTYPLELTIPINETKSL